MADFIHFEAVDENEKDVEMMSDDNENSSMGSFINDNISEQNRESHPYFHNIQVDLKEANQRIEKEALERIKDCDEYSNLSYISDEDDLASVHDFKNSVEQINKFKANLLPTNQNEMKYEFIKIILYKIRQILEGKQTIVRMNYYKKIPR